MIEYSILINILASALASYQDIQENVIENWLSYGIIAIGLITTILGQEWIGLIIALLVLGIGLIGFHFDQMGGGDVKLLTGLSLIQPFYHGFPFIFGVFFVAGISGLIYRIITKKDAIPFATFIFIGVLATYILV